MVILIQWIHRGFFRSVQLTWTENQLGGVVEIEIGDNPKRPSLENNAAQGKRILQSESEMVSRVFFCCVGRYAVDDRKWLAVSLQVYLQVPVEFGKDSPKFASTPRLPLFLVNQNVHHPEGWNCLSKVSIETSSML